MSLLSAQDCVNRSAGSSPPYWDIDYGVQTYLASGVPAEHSNFGLVGDYKAESKISATPFFRGNCTCCTGAAMP